MKEEIFRRNFPFGYALVKVIFNAGGKPENYLFSEVNYRFEKISGLKGDNITGKTISEVIKDSNIEKINWKVLINNVFDKPKTETSEYYTEISGRYYKILSFLQQEDIILSVFSDITEKVEENSKLSKIIENANIGIWEWNIISGEVEFNEQWAKIVGYTLEELSPVSIDTWIKLSHPDDLLLSNDKLNEHFRGETSQYTCEVRMRHKSGKWVWVLDSGKVTQWSPDGQPLLMSGIHQNITDRKESEIQLQQKLKIEKLLTEISAEFIHTKDVDVSINNAFSKLARITSASRVYLFMLNEDDETMSNTHEWCAEGVSAEKDNLQDIPVSIFPWWMEKLSQNEVIDIPDVSQMPPEAGAEKELLESQDIKSLLVLPVYFESRLAGFVGFDNVVSGQIWSNDESQLLKLLANLLSNAIIRKFNENDLKKSYNNLRNYFDFNTEMVFIVNESGEIIKINRQVKEKLGYSEEEVLGINVLMMHPEELRTEAAGIFEDMLTAKRDFCPLPLVTKDGKRILVETIVRRGLWDGKPAIFGICKDISDLVLSEVKFSEIFHNIPEISALISMDTGNLIEVNKAFYTRLGYQPNEVIGQDATSLFNFKSSYDDTIGDELIRKGFVNNKETIIQTKNGEALNVLFSASIIKIVDSRYVLYIATDITENVKVNELLKLAKDRAEESDRLKLAFLATMNHELRTPLNHVLGFSDMIPDMTEDENIKEFAHMIHDSGTNLLNIVEDIFDLAMLEQSDVKIRKDEVFIRDIYSELKKQLQEVLTESNKSEYIQLEYKIDSIAATKKIISDKHKILQVMSNLFKNAVKFTDNGIISLSVSLENAKFLNIIVSDTGIGIPEDKLGVIFDFFRQADDSHTRKHGGVGIGLAISQRIAHAIRGKISVNSLPGKGSEFTFSFPVEFNNEETDNLKPNSINSLIPDLSGRKILIVEDNDITMRMIISLLSLSHCEIIKSNNGLSALENVISHPDIDIVLMDLKMPLMDGFEATKAIRKDFKELPVIALTAYSLEKDKKKAIEAGCNDIITKPVNKQLLFTKIQQYLKN